MKRRFLGALVAGATLAVLTTSERPSSGESSPVGTVSGKVTILVDGTPKVDRSGAIVYLEGVPGVPPGASRAQQMRQKDLTFAPGFMVVVKGTNVEFPNDDKVFHNVFSLSKPAKFDLGLYKSGDSKSVTFKQTGVVDVYCNIHPQMAAKIKIVDNGFFTTTAADGTFKIKSVPPGKYPVVGWIPAGSAEFRGEVEVTAGGVATVDVSLVETDEKKSHLRKDGTPYGRYK
jgi:plastocyanin